MMLSRLQARRFLNVFDALVTYANERLAVVADAGCRGEGPNGIDEDARGRIAAALWQNRTVIDDFVRENPSGLSAGELGMVSAWRSAMYGLFVLDVFPDGEVRFIQGGYAFEALGALRDPAEDFRLLPAAAEALLLPFDGRIVYIKSPVEHAIDFGEGMLEVFQDEVERIFDEQLVVRVADDFLEVAEELREREFAKDSAEMLSDLERGRFDSFAEQPCDCEGGHHHSHAEEDEWDDEFDEFDTFDYEQHVGELAGLSFEERERAIEDYMLLDDDSIAGRLVELLDEDCETIPLTTSLAELLAAEDQLDVRRFAGYLGMSNTRALDDGELHAAIVERVADASCVQVIIDELSEHHIEALRTLAGKAGRWDVEEDDIVSLRELPVHELGLCYVFHEDETFKFVMPSEILAIADQIDWEGALAKARKYRELINLIDDLAELRGIVSMAEAVAEYQRCYPDGYESMREIMAYVFQAAAEGSASFELLETPSREMYVLHYELFWAYQEVMGIEESLYESEPITRGELGELLEDLLKQQAGKPPRLLSDEMLAARSLFDWKARRPAVQEFCRYLDEHVPDIADDFYFADKVIEELLNDAMWGLAERGTQPLFDILEANDFICSSEQIQDVLDLWVNFTNDLPNWPNNGWAPAELAEGAARGMQAATGDSFGKVGRNDPCPCGSGLKYKKCHGR